ncbi:MAG: hypothetical protein MUC94_08325, partial [bacterium]|nr:hypothetical protein [bacterium]
MRMIELPKITGSKKERIVDFISKEEVHILAENTGNKRNKLMVLICFYAGLRVDELLKIRPYSFNWIDWIKDKSKTGELKVIGKGNKERIVLIPSKL